MKWCSREGIQRSDKTDSSINFELIDEIQKTNTRNASSLDLYDGRTQNCVAFTVYKLAFSNYHDYKVRRYKKYRKSENDDDIKNDLSGITSNYFKFSSIHLVVGITQYCC